MASSKDVIYIDIDDEITSIIDKVKSSSHSIVALVLPKRATMLQSSVNMKLLKRAADGAKKQAVLITSEASLLPLAGAVSLPVAKTLQSKPEIPVAAAAVAAAGMDELLDAEDTGPVEDFDPKDAADQPVGKLAGQQEEAGKAKPELTPRPIPRASQPDDTVELDNAEPAAAIPEASKAKKAKNKKLKVPDFNKFRLRLIIIAAVLIILIGGFILGNIVLPKAKVIIATTTSKVNTSQNINLSTSASALDPSSLTVPAHLQQTSKTSSQQVPTTGTKNEGQTASGSVTMTNCSSSGEPITIPTGTGITTSSGLTYITQSTANLSTSTFDHNGNCKATVISSQTVNITAQSPGANYNVSNGTNFSVGNPNVTATGSASGGTDNNVQIVTQADINNATQKLGSQDTSSIKSGLQTGLQQGGWYAITTTFNGAPSTTNSANVGDQANTVTVTQTVNYTMFGVHKSDLQKLADSSINGQIDTSKQSIQDDGVGQASFTVLSQSGTAAQVTMQTTGIVGPKIDIADLKKQIAGKKSGDVQSIIQSTPGVTGVTVNYSPFWVSSTPKSTSKITIEFKKAP